MRILSCLSRRHGTVPCKAVTTQLTYENDPKFSALEKYIRIHIRDIHISTYASIHRLILTSSIIHALALHIYSFSHELS